MVSVNIVFLLVLVLSLPGINAAANWINNEHIALANASAFIIRQHFSRFTTTVVIVEKSVQPRMRVLNTHLFQNILLNLNQTIAVQLYLGQSEDQPWDYHIFVVDSAEAFRAVRMMFPRTQYERKFRFLIILTSYTRRYFRVLREIFTLSYEFHVLNVNVILHHPSLGVCMYTYTLFAENKCRSVQPVLYFQFNDGFKNLRQVFSKKLMNFNGCPLRVTARQNPPLLTFAGYTRKPEGYWVNLDEIDGRLIKLIAQNLNFTIELLPFPTERSYVNNNDSYGCFAELLNGNADVAIGGFSASDPKRSVLSPSVLYHQSQVVLVVRGSSELSSISRLARPFKLQLWGALAIFLTAVTFIVHALRAVNPSIRQFVVGERNDTPLTNFFAIFLGYSVNPLPRKNFARYVLLLWLLMAMILRNAYQGSLYDAIRMDTFVKVPPDYKELLKRNYKIFVSNELHDLDILPKNSTIVLSDEYDLRFKLLEVLTGKYATVALSENFLNYMERNLRYGSDLKIIREPLYLRQSAMYFPKHSIYKSAFNTNLRRFSYVGITTYISRNSAKEISEMKFHIKGFRRPISNDRLSGMYEIYGSMVVLAVLVLILELLSVFNEKLRCFIERIS